MNEASTMATVENLNTRANLSRAVLNPRVTGNVYRRGAAARGREVNNPVGCWFDS